MVVDDHPIVCDGIALLLQQHPGIEMVGYARDAAEAIDTAVDVDPDVILLDLRLPDMLATEAAPRLRAVVPRASILVFTAYTDDAALARLREAGVTGCLLKDATRTDFVEGIRRAARGEEVFDVRVDDGWRQRRHERHSTDLTPREREVLRRAAMGETNPEIGAAIGLSRNTVKAYVQSALRKLNARNRVEAIARAHEAGII